MRYLPSGIKIPENKWAEINQKVLYLIENGLCDQYGVTKTDIFNSYTGNGGTRALERQDYDSYYHYSEAKKELEAGQFFTPYDLCFFLMQTIKPSNTELIADLTCGTGHFFNHLPILGNVYGYDLDLSAVKVARHLYPGATLEHNDLRYARPQVTFDLIIGNPPFNISLRYHGDSVSSQMAYFLKSAELLKPAGLLAAIVPNSFLADAFADKHQIESVNQRFNFIGQVRLDPGAFKSVGVSAFATKIVYLQKKSEHLPENAFDPPSFIEETDPEQIYQKYIAPVKSARETAKAKIFFESKSADKGLHQFNEKTRKLLFDIKRNPKLIERYAKAADLVSRYHSQRKPKDMNFEEWQKVRLTKTKVLARLRSIVKNQHKVEKDVVRLVKTNYGLKLKPYSKKAQLYLSKYQGPRQADIAQLVFEGSYPFEDKTYQRLIGRKIEDYKLQNTKIMDLAPSKQVLDFLDDFTLYHSGKKKIIRLNARQKSDLALIITKGCGNLDWQMGSGKTLAGIAYLSYFMKHSHLKNTFIVSDALAIKGTWVDYLGAFGIPFILVQKIADLNRIEPGQIVLFTHYVLGKYKRQIKKFVRMLSQKLVLIIDESDDYTNAHSARTRAGLACFRKIRNVLELTGTITRNTAQELFAQLALIYNNSYNLICHCDTVFEYDSKEGDLKEKSNPYYQCPFPARGGFELFKKCFNPFKQTVFGIHRHNQDIFNSQALVDILEKTVITRSFKEVVGREIYTTETIRVSQNPAEKALYLKILKDLVNMYLYFKKSESSRKDAMLRLIRQIKLLIKAASMPHCFAEYQCEDRPNKYYEIRRLVNLYPNQKVSIGSIHKAAVSYYFRHLSEDLPDRPVFWVDGTINIKQRKKIIREFEATVNGVLVCTQQSLRSSINIESCDICVLESLPWNLPRASQHYFRFIRFDSERDKKVYFVTYKNTIEQNLMALLIAKERVNQFMQFKEHIADQDLFDQFGIDASLLDDLISKEYDTEGQMHLTWGEQKISAEAA